MRKVLIAVAPVIETVAPHLPLPLLRWLTIFLWWVWKGKDGRRQLNRYLLVKRQQEG